MIYTALTEAFFTFLKVSFYGALFISFPIIALQIYKFAAPGLYKEEKKAFLPFLIATPVLFGSGAALVYYFIFPLAWRFFLGFQTSTIESGMAIELEAKVNEYLSLVLKLMFAFGLAFQIPVALTLLSRAGIVHSNDLKKRRKYAIVLAFVVAAILTPPDLISQIGLGIPIIILFEISIILAKLFEKKKDQNKKKSKIKKNIGDTDYSD
jgi:sec-independent protein translocase protein TatC